MRKTFIITLLWAVAFSLFPLQAAMLEKEKPVSFSFSKAEDTLEFTVNHPGDRLIALEVEFSGNGNASGAIRVTGDSLVEAGPVNWKNNFDRELFVHDGPVSVLDNMIPTPGVWKVKLNGVNLPVSGKLSLIDQGAVSKIAYSEKTGAIQIKKPGSQEFVAVGCVEHPDFSLSENEFSGSVTADGDIMIPLPVGFYSLKHPGALVSSMQAHLIPVHADKITIVENWPQSPQPDVEAGNDSEGKAAASVTVQLEKDLRIRSLKLLDQDRVNVRFATPQWQGIINKQELEAYEGGIKSEVLEAGPVDSPLSLTILLDSSGSMKKDMKLAIDSVEQFIKLLPDNCEINLVDFDTKTKEIMAKDRAGLIKSLKSIKADGATCLNDSVMLGLKKSERKGRPAVLLFTDGFDANHNDTGPGSKTKPEEMYAAVKTSEVPVFTIGFGAKPDDATLKRLATLSGGVYSKADKGNINKVFAQVAAILGREHQMVYKRPGVSGNSDAPVISIVLDVSGSMNLSPEDQGCDYRLEKAKAILRSMINKLPEDAIAQITTYSFYQNVVQVFTGDKMQLLASLAPIEAGGGTATLETLQVAFKMLKEVPTDRRYLLFITDAGLDIESNRVDYEAVLGSIKDAGVQTTWIGMVEGSEKAPFDLAAKLCNGQAVVSTDFAAVQEAIDNLGKAIVNASGTTDGKIPVKLGFSRREENGRMLTMTAADKFVLPAPPVTSKAAVNGLKIIFADMPASLQRYSLELNQTLYGNSKTRDETIISQRLPVNATCANAAMKLTVQEILLMKRFRGVNINCAALKLRLENILPEQEIAVISGSDAHPANVVGQSGQAEKTVRTVLPYMIPNVQTHFFAAFNNLSAVPVSELSWVVEDPLLMPDDAGLLLKAGQPVEGYLIFNCPDTVSLSRASLNYYDTVYGHMQIPVIGTLDSASQTAELFKLPQEVSGNVSEAFSLSLKGFRDEAMPEPMAEMVMRVFDLQMTSRVQALLDMNPGERLSLLLPTRFGNLVVPPSPRTQSLPMGWYQPQLFLPGSHNYLRQAYVIPRSLGKKANGILRFDIAGGEIMLSAGDQTIKPAKPLLTAAGDKIQLAVNAYKVLGSNVLLDLTLTDEKDGSGTAVQAADICQLQVGDEICGVDDTGNYMLQITDQVEVADGQQRRFLLVINTQTDDAALPMTLKSSLFKLDMPLKPSKQGELDDYMLCGTDYYSYDNSSNEEISALVAKVHAERLASGWKKKGSSDSEKVTIGDQKALPGDTADGVKDGLALAPPDFKSAQASRLKQVLQMSETEFLAFIKTLRCVPAEQNFAQGIYAPEAILMQGWGTQSDLCELARLYYKSTGALVDEKRELVKLSDSGKEELFKITGWKTELEYLPVLAVGQKRLVFPFVKELDAMGNLLEEAVAEESPSNTDLNASINITLRVKPRNSGHAAQMGSMGDALGGESDEEGTTSVVLFNAYHLTYATCSRAPIDIFYYSPDNGQTLYAMAEWAAGRIENHSEPVSLADYEVIEENIEIRLDDEILTFSRPLTKDTSIIDTFRTIALCVPDITASASQALADEFAARKTDDAPGTRSTTRWFTRARIFQFLALQTEAETEAARQTGVKTGRPGTRMRAIILSLIGEKGKLRAMLDLRQVNPVVQGDEKAVQAFNFFMGITNTMLEDQVMGGGSLFRRWTAGEKQQLVIAGPDDVTTLIEGLDETMVSEATRALLVQAAEAGNGVIFPLYAAMSQGKALPAWFTFNPETYEMVSVLDNGAHGSLVEKPITEIIQDAAKYGVGFFVGVNASVWAVTAYSLKYDDMRLIVKAAKQLCLGIAAQLNNIGKPLGELLPKIPDSYTAHESSVSVGPATVKVGFGEITPTSFKLMTKPSISFNFSYQSGFEDAVKAYFHD